MLTIRPILLKEMVFPIELAAKEGWNPGLYDGYNYFNIDPEGFFLAELNGGMAGIIWAVRYNMNYGVIGGHIVLPPFRKQGIGEALLNKALEHLQVRTIGMDGLECGENYYKRFGFIPEHRVIRYGGIILADACLSFRISSAGDVDFYSLTAYDEQMFGAARPQFLKAWIEQPGAESACYMEDDKIMGFGIIRPSRRGYRLGPLFADSPQAAKSLLCHLACKAGDDHIYLDVPQTNTAAIRLVESLGMQPVFSRLRLYNKQGLDLPLQKIYGFTTLDIG